jgi:hypothetical protein
MNEVVVADRTVNYECKMFSTLASDLNRTEKELIKTFCVSIKRKKMQIIVKMARDLDEEHCCLEKSERKTKNRKIYLDI